MEARIGTCVRETAETQIQVTLNLDGRGNTTVSTGIGFFDHMLTALGRHWLVDLELTACGDLHVDDHHTVEDTGLCLGKALDDALGTRQGIRRYGWALLPMDDSLSRVALDFGGRAYLIYRVANRRRRIGTFDLGLCEEFFRALVGPCGMNLHIQHLYGAEPHHAYESIFKGVARALRMACEQDPRETGIPSSKNTIDRG